MEKIKNLHFFNKLSKLASFKEGFFVFEEKGAEAETGEKPKPKIDILDEKEKVQEKRREERREEANETARNLTLDPLDQKLFNSILDDPDEGPNPALLSVTTNLDKLVNFASSSPEAKDNMEKILDAITDEDIKIKNISDSSLIKLLNYYSEKSEQDDLADEVFEAAVEDKDAPTSKLATVLKNISGEKKDELIENLYEALEDKEIYSGELDRDLIGILFGYYWEKSDKEKIEFMLEEFCKNSKSASEFISISKDHEEIIKAVFEKLKNNQKIIQQISNEAVSILIKTIPVKEVVGLLKQRQVFLQLRSRVVNTETKKEIIKTIGIDKISLEDKLSIITTFGEVNLEITKLLFESLSDADKEKVDPKIKEKITGEKPDTKDPAKPAKTEIETGSHDKQGVGKFEIGKVSLPEGMEIKGKSIVWNLIEERSFIKTKVFEKAFAKALKDGEVDPKNPESVRLFCYKWLWEKVYKSGKRTGNPYGLKDFHKAQGELEKEIKRLGEALKPKTSDTNPPTGETAAGEAPTGGTTAPKIEAPTDATPPAASTAPSDTGATGDATPPATGTAPADGIQPTPDNKPPTIIEKPEDGLEFAKIDDKKINLPNGKEYILDQDTYISINEINKNFQTIITNKSDIILYDAKAKVAFLYNTGDSSPEWKSDPANTKPDEEQTKAIKAAEARAKTQITEDGKPKSPEDTVPEIPAAKTDTQPPQLLKDPAQKIKELEETGLKIKTENNEELKILTVDQFNKIEEAQELLQKTFSTDPDVFAVISSLREAGRKLDLALSLKEIKVEFKPDKSNTVVKWSSTEEKNYGFGEEPALIDTILQIKRDQLGEDSEEYQKFFELSRTSQVETGKEGRTDEKHQKYIESYKKLTEEPYEIDYRIGDFSEENIVKYWTQFDGYSVVEDCLVKAPFNVFPNLEKTKAAQIISDGSNRKVYFEDIFKYMGGFPGVDRSKIPEEFLKSGDDFLEEFNRLMNKPYDKLTQQEQTRLETMYTEVMVPCLDLLNAMQHLGYPEDGIKEEDIAPYDQIELGLAEGQGKVIEGLYKLFNYTESPASTWSKIMNFFAGGETTITMSRADGSTFVIDDGMFKRHYNPHSALLALINKPGIYNLDNEGKKVIDPEKLLTEINRIIKTGEAQLLLQKVFQGRHEPSEDFTIKSLDDLANLTDKQMAVFQLGFINDKLVQSTQKVKQAAEILKEAPPAVKAILEKFKDQVPPAELDQMKSVLLTLNYLHFHKEGDGDYKAAGFGIGTKIPLGPDSPYSIMVGAGADFKGDVPVLAGIGLDITLYKGESTVISQHQTISILGASVGISGSHDLGKGIKFGWDFGLGFNWKNLTLGGAANISLSWEDALINAQKDVLDEKAREESGLLDLWNQWSKLDNTQKWELLEKHPQYETIKALMEANKDYLTKEHVLNGITLYIEQLKAKEVYNKLTAIPFLPVGINIGVMAGLAPALGAIGILAGAKFQIGSVTVFIPHPREISRLLSQISNITSETQVRKSLEGLKDGTTQVDFTEQTPNIYFRPGSKLGLGVRVGEKKEINLGNIQTDLEASNKALKPAEIRLVKIAENRIELVVDNDDDKDVEIHIDPTLHDMALVRDDNGRIFIEGNVNDLIISRERFEFPYALAEGQASIRDIVTIRQARSVTANRDRLWMEQHEQEYLEKIMGNNGYRVQRGINYNATQDNIIRAKGYTGGTAAERAAHYDQYETGVGTIDRATADKWDEDTVKMGTALGERLDSEHEADRSLDNAELYKRLDNLYKDAKFKRELIKDENLSDPDNVIGLIEKYAEKYDLKGLTPKELDIAASYLLNSWFTTLYKGKETGELSDFQKTAINKQLINRLKAVSKYTSQRYLKEFKDLDLKKLGIKSTPEDMVKQLLEDIYGDMIRALEKIPPIDFRTVFNVGKGLEAGDIFVSGTRTRKGGRTIPALGKVMTYEQVDKASRLIDEYGFLAHKAKEGETPLKVGEKYSLKDQEIKGDLARALLVIASPIAADDMELIKSPLALKILGLKAYRLIVEEEGGGGAEQYKAMIEIMEDPTKVTQYPEEIARFRKFIERVRASQLKGEPLTIRTTQGLIITLNMSTTVIESGAYSKCGNPSYKVNEGGTISIKRPQRVAGTMDVTNEVMDVELSKRFVSFGLTSGFTSTEAPKPKEEETPPEHKGQVGTDYGTRGEAPIDKGLGGGPAGAATHTDNPPQYE